MVEQRRKSKVLTVYEKMGRLRKGAGWMIVSVAMLLGAWAAPAQAAEFDVEPAITDFSVSTTSTQAGAHPDVEFTVAWNASGFGCTENCVTPRRLKTHFPTGFVGNPHIAPKCTQAAFATNSCSADSQIGVFKADLGGFEVGFIPLYNLETTEEQAGLTGFTLPLFNLPVFLELSGRTDSDYGLDSIGTPLLRAPIVGVKGTLWGVPADPVHNPLRFITPMSGGGQCPTLAGCTVDGFLTSKTFAEPTVPRAPFLQNPTTCDGNLIASQEVEYYANVSAYAEAPQEQLNGCQQLSFNPSQTTKPTTTQADTASGVDVDLKVPQTQSPSTASPSQIRTNSVTLPPGFSINPGAADGKLACTDSQTAIGTLFGATCPDFAKVGTAELDVATLPAPIFGGLYLGEPKPGDPYRLILTADGFATHVKLPASVHPDETTGRVTTVFEDLPQSPVQRVNLHFFGSERGLLATPEQCGTYEVQNTFVPWDSELTTRLSKSFITIDSGPGGTPCPNGLRPFAPTASAGSTNNTAGRYTPFTFILKRDDGNQRLAGVSVTPPPGFAANLSGIPYCPETAIAQLFNPEHKGRTELASPSCPAASQVGSTVAGGGAGTHPLYVGGAVYLAGPYRGSPLSLVVAIPAVSGPYDLGVIAVRVAVQVDPRTARVSAVSDPLPQIREGIPLRTRYIKVSLDRPDFAITPTNCNRMAVDSLASGTGGATKLSSSAYQVSNCVDLPYGPKLNLKLSGGLRRRGHPAIHAAFKPSTGEANSRRVSVLLPKGELLDNGHIGTVCSRVQFASDSCPKDSVYGWARAATPLLDQPLTGPVVLRSSNNKLPDLVADLSGQFNFVLAGKVDSVRGRLRTIFQNIPDIPVSRFDLKLKGGRKGLLQNSESLCGRSKSAMVKSRGQNGVAVRTRSKLQTNCKSKKNAGRSRSHSRKAGK